MFYINDNINVNLNLKLNLELGQTMLNIAVHEDVIHLQDDMRPLSCKSVMMASSADALTLKLS